MFSLKSMTKLEALTILNGNGRAISHGNGCLKDQQNFDCHGSRPVPVPLRSRTWSTNILLTCAEKDVKWFIDNMVLCVKRVAPF